MSKLKHVSARDMNRAFTEPTEPREQHQRQYPKHRPHKGRLSPRAVRTWRDSFASFVHAEPHNLVTTNPPPPTEPRFERSLNSVLFRLGTDAEFRYIVDDIEDGQTVTNPVNRAGALARIAGEKFSALDWGSGMQFVA